jgi:mono/diheme cytochrome c family protein
LIEGEAMTRKPLIFAAIAVVLLAGCVALWIMWEPGIAVVQPPPASSFDRQLKLDGARVVALGDCAVCHTAKGGKPFAGGLPLATPFGTIYATNITPDADTGIGAWSLDAFTRALRRGMSRDGHQLYPAFPYIHFTWMSDHDVSAAYAYLMSRDPVKATTPDNELIFPLNFRPLVAFWNMMFLRPGERATDTAQSIEWNRGRPLDAQGRIVDWNYALWSSSHNERIVNAGRLMPATLLAKPFVCAPSTPMLQPEGGGDRNAVPLYVLPNVHVMNNFSPTMPLHTSAMRSLGAHTNVFAIESFMDELALAAQTDPVEFRLKHLQDPRAHVIRLAAKEFGWPRAPRQANHGVGFAFGKYKNLMAYVAIAVELSVERETGQVHVEHAVAAVDSGQIVNPDGIRNQIEGGIIQSTSWTLYEERKYDTSRIRSFDWSTYPIMRFSAVPGSVKVHLIDRPGAPFLGSA